VGDDGDPKLVGKSVKDTLPFAAIPNAKGANKIFNTDQYTAKDKKGARDRLHGYLEDLLKSPYGVMWLDTNKLILEQDPAFGRTVHEVVKDLGFVEVARDSFVW
jgi:hypothetical protein